MAKTTKTKQNPLDLARRSIDGALERIQDDVSARVYIFEERTEREAQKLLRRAKTTSVGRALRQVPKQVTTQFDRLLDRVGLMRKARHEELLARTRRRATAKRTRTPKRASSASTTA